MCVGGGQGEFDYINKNIHKNRGRKLIRAKLAYSPLSMLYKEKLFPYSF